MRKLLTLAICIVALSAAPAMAETSSAFPDFQAKRIKPPKPGSKKRITIQIDAATFAAQRAPKKPAAAPRPPEGAEGADPGTAIAAANPDGSITPSGRYGWFWESISPLMADSGPGRLSPALTRIDNPPSGNAVLAPRLQHLQDIAQAQGIDILRTTVGTKVSPALVLAVIAVESGGRIDAISSAGAQGLMQLMPATADRFGVKNSLSPGENIRGGVAYLDWLMKEFNGDPMLVLAGYNAGEGSVRKHKGVPPYTETRDYVPKVLAAFKVASGLCQTPPELITDGCVFTRRQDS